MAKQSAKDRAQRLRAGCCPIHGTPMPQVGTDVIDGKPVSVVGCPRKDCTVQATQAEHDGGATLLPAWSHLLTPVPVL